MLLKDLPTKRKETTIFKVQFYEFLCWQELPKAFKTFELAEKYMLLRGITSNNSVPMRIVKRTNKGWEIV
jgi:hypothetical protein